MSIHTHSHMAFEDMQTGGKLSRRQAAILAWLLTRNRPHTDREVAAGMGYPDMNAVRPRITELLRMGILEETDAVHCPITSKRVRRVQPTETQSELPL
jgi:hypothetical protein